eukprot:CAMPEP_0113323814 /NCGR_PEP_ID=MMETSP0010_2-20120614/16583_1 /TAXON_ID=216773 ORGANISM="Corethron hystrix, Strain 308" /NCGR_SAMPLE_ID=MMETSP0010_2 /ASSEMBLY_ACC=CAM_ASM_000155 /LENGTH=339 /DNA_ID=CAMNT_0000182893 /DNA_START=233 /DNA_END=1252 /DNA_ORIENTATION=+ /assembly_acc=CAM_ASM_000155
MSYLPLSVSMVAVFFLPIIVPTIALDRRPSSNRMFFVSSARRLEKPISSVAVAAKAATITTVEPHPCSSMLDRRSVLTDIIFKGTVSATSVVFSFPIETPAALAANKEAKENLSTSGKNNRLKNRLGKRILTICGIMDELQRDLFQNRWDLIEQYPTQLRSFVPVLTTFTDTAFPGDGSDQGLRVALRYEVGRFFGAVERLKLAVSRKDIDAAYLAYANMALHFDRYLKAGILYQYQEISTEKYFENLDDSIIYADPRKNPAYVRDLVILASGPDKGRTGTVIGIFPDTQNRVVKLDRYDPTSPIREIKVVTKEWAALRLGEQDPDAVFLIPRKDAKEE